MRKQQPTPGVIWYLNGGPVPAGYEALDQSTR